MEIVPTKTDVFSSQVASEEWLVSIHNSEAQSMHENRVFLRSTQAAHVADHDATDSTGMPENTEQNTWNQRSYQVDARIENIASQEILCRTCNRRVLNKCFRNR